MNPCIGMGLVLLFVIASVNMTVAKDLVAQQSGEAMTESAASAVEKVGDTVQSWAGSRTEPICVLGINGKRCDKPRTPQLKSIESSADVVKKTNRKNLCVKKVLTESGDVVCQD